MQASQAGRRIAGLAALLFAAASIALTVAVERESMWWLDTAVRDWIRAARSPLGIAAMLAVSHLSSEYVTPVVILICTWLMGRRGGSRAFSLYFLLMAATSTVWQIALKRILERPRPQPPLVPFWSGAGYPSGHALSALCISLGWLLWLRWHAVGLRRAQLTAVRGALVAWPLLVGASRIYIDAHWTSDVLGGLLFGAMHFCGSWFIAGRWPTGAAALTDTG